MNAEKRSSFDLDIVAGLVTGFLLLSITLVVFVGYQIGVRVIVQLPQDSLIGPFEALTLVFSEPVDGSLAIEKVFIQPEVKGKYQWVDEKTLRFVPMEPFQPDTVYTLALAPGPLASNGGSLKKAQSWKFQVRKPLIAYMVASGQQSRLWTVEPDSGKTRPLTNTVLRILDFDTSRNGEFVVFSAFNEQQGIDLWRVGRTGDNAALLLECGFDRCSVPAISPDGRRVAYVREAAGPPPDLAYGAPRIWILDIDNKRDNPLYEDQQILGYRPVWSPDGTRLSSFDWLADEIRLLDLVTSEQLIIPSQTGNPVAWSADGSNFLFTDIETVEFGLHTRIRQARLSIKEIVTLFGDNDERAYYYNSLAWSPTSNRLVIGLQPNEGDPAGALWLVDLDTMGGQTIVNEPNYTYNTPYWDPWGRALIFQQFKLHGVYEPEIGLWMPGFEEPRILAEGIMSHWLP